MAKSIDARRKGDEYQARFFWLKLLELRTENYVESVTFESDEVPLWMILLFPTVSLN